MKKYNKAIIALSFDDGRSDTYRVAKEVLELNCIPATINIATGYIEGKTKAGTNIPPMTRENVIELHNSGLFEIAAHGDMHKNDFEDIARGKEKLLSWLGKDAPVGFASPGSEMTVDFINNRQDKLKQIGFSYARTSYIHQKTSFPKLRIFLRRVARITRSAFIYRCAYYGLSVVDDYAVTSVPVLNFTTVRQIKSAIRLAIRRRGFLNLMFHSVCKPGELCANDINSYDYDKFVKIIIYLTEKRTSGKIKILTTEEVVDLERGK